MVKYTIKAIPTAYVNHKIVKNNYKPYLWNKIKSRTDIHLYIMNIKREDRPYYCANVFRSSSYRICKSYR